MPARLFQFAAGAKPKAALGFLEACQMYGVPFDVLYCRTLSIVLLAYHGWEQKKYTVGCAPI
jgi:hypothetical protein